MHFNGKGVDFLRNLPLEDSSKNPLHSHRNALVESANPQPADFDVTLANVWNSDIT